MMYKFIAEKGLRCPRNQKWRLMVRGRLSVKTKCVTTTMTLIREKSQPFN
jgi:hypothetical protein